MQLRLKSAVKHDPAPKDFLIKVVDGAKEVIEEEDLTKIEEAKKEYVKSAVIDEVVKPGVRVRWYRPVLADYLEDGESNTPRWKEIDPTEIRQEWFILPKTKEQYFKQQEDRKIAKARAKEAALVEAGEVIEIERPNNMPICTPAVSRDDGANGPASSTFQVAWRNSNGAARSQVGTEKSAKKEPPGKEGTR